MHCIWQLIPTNRNISPQLCFMASLCTVKVLEEPKLCEYCTRLYDHYLVHLISSCSKYNTAREVYWNILVDTLSPSSSAYLHSLSEWDFVCLIFKKVLKPNKDMTYDDAKEAVIITAKVWYCLRSESTTLGLWYVQNTK